MSFVLLYIEYLPKNDVVSFEFSLKFQSHVRIALGA